MRCPHCSLEIPIGQQFCGSCGKRVDMGFDQIQESVLSDAADRRAGLTEKILLNAIGLFIVVWVGVKLLNDHYVEARFPASRTGSVCMDAPQPQTESSNQLDIKIEPGQVPMPQVTTVSARGLSWRREPFKAKMCEAVCTREEQEQVRGMIRKGLAYLASRQGKDGGWYVSREGGSKLNDWGRVGVTGLALLAFLGDGHTWVPIGEDSKGQPVYSPYAAVIRNGVNYLTSQMHMDGADAGLIGPKSGHFTYNQGFATAALCEAYASSGDAWLEKAATRATNYIISAQQRSGGWDYYEKPSTRADTSVTCCQLSALYAAKLAGIKVPAQVFQNGLRWIDSVTDPETFNVGYDRKWDHTQKSIGYGCTAMGLMFQLYMGRSPSAEPVRRQAKTLSGLRPPEYNDKWSSEMKAEKVDYYYLYHATMAFNRLGGDEWKTWNKAMIRMLAGTQDKGGAWPFYDTHGSAGGRIFTTSVALLTLEVYSRYP